MNRFGEYLLLTILFSTSAFGTILAPVLKDEGVVTPDNNKFIDPNTDYTRFYGRVTDRDDTGRILKVKVENNNTKFLKAGDVIHFKINNQDKGYFCKASVRSIEDYYFSVYVQDYSGCWEEGKYFPRGMQLNFKSNRMADRVFEASKYRELLLLRKDGFLTQLNDLNNFLWTFDQQKLKTVATFDEQINELKRQKQLAIDNLIQKKQESMVLQTELIKKLDNLDTSLDHYRIERKEYLTDRWHIDHDSDLPFSRRPQEIKKP